MICLPVWCPVALTSKTWGATCSSSGMMWGRQKALSMLQEAGFEVEAWPARGLSIGMFNQQWMVWRNINWVMLPSEEEMFTIGQWLVWCKHGVTALMFQGSGAPQPTEIGIQLNIKWIQIAQSEPGQTPTVSSRGHRNRWVIGWNAAFPLKKQCFFMCMCFCCTHEHNYIYIYI